MLILESAMATIGCIYLWIVFRTSKPRSPPSLAATRRMQSITQGMWNDTKILMRNKNFLFLAISFTLVYSVYNCIGNTLNFLMTPLGYGSS